MDRQVCSHSFVEAIMQAILIPTDGGRPVRLEKEVTVVGRRRWVCDVYFDDPTISKFHCLIMHTGDGLWFARDLGSANGTRINGRKITEEALRDGDELAFANQKYRWQIGSSSPDVTTAVPEESVNRNPNETAASTLSPESPNVETEGNWESIMQPVPELPPHDLTVHTQERGSLSQGLRSSQSDVTRISDPETQTD